MIFREGRYTTGGRPVVILQANDIFAFMNMHPYSLLKWAEDDSVNVRSSAPSTGAP